MSFSGIMLTTASLAKVALERVRPELLFAIFLRDDERVCLAVELWIVGLELGLRLFGEVGGMNS